MNKHFLKFWQVVGLLFFSVLGLHQAFAQIRAFPSGTQEIFISANPQVRADLLKKIAPIIKSSIKDGYYPGAVVLAGHSDQIIYQGVFGNRRITPDIAPMRLDTIFDVASLTKVVVTTPAIMQLIEQKKLKVDDRVAKYWPAFARNGKASITIRQLLTHTSGLPAEVPLSKKSAETAANKKSTLQKIAALKLTHPPGTTFLYSDVDFLVLGHLVEIISKKPLNVYATNYIFKPLKMNHTSFLPPNKWKNSIAPSEVIKQKLRWGEVHDPPTHHIGGVSGAAGLFSTAPDLSRYARALLNGGRIANAKNRHLLTPRTISNMTTPQTPRHMEDVRGLGWDIDSRFSVRGEFFSALSFGHTGWTGTSMWLDPKTQTWLIILTSRAHPKPAHRNILKRDRLLVANLVGASVVN